MRETAAVTLSKDSGNFMDADDDTDLRWIVWDSLMATVPVKFMPSGWLGVKLSVP